MYGLDDGSMNPVFSEYSFAKCETVKGAATFGGAGCSLHGPQSTSHTDRDVPRVPDGQISAAAAPPNSARHWSIGNFLFLAEDTQPRTEFLNNKTGIHFEEVFSQSIRL